MRLIGVLALSVAACGSKDDGFPVGGPGTDGGLSFPDSSGGRADARTDALSDGAVSPIDADIFTGRVCLAADPRKLNACASTGAGGLTVRLGTATATTSDDGSFMIAGQSSANVWRVTGANIVSSYMPLGDYEIPAISRTTYNAMITNNLQGLQLNPGEGSVMLQIINNGTGYTGVTGFSSPASSWQPFYDDPSSATPTKFQQTATGFDGMMWIPGIDVGNATITATDTSDTASKGPLPVFDGGITFSTIIFPPH